MPSLIHLVMPSLVAITGRPALFRREMEEWWIWGRREIGGIRRQGGRGGCGWDVLYERIKNR